jgi:hypothetical protein
MSRGGRSAGIALAIVRRTAPGALALAFAAAPALAQDATPFLGTATAGPATSLESYLVQPGRLLVERTHLLPPVALDRGATLRLEAVVAYEPAREHERVLGIRARLAGVPEPALAYLDLHEVEDLARTLAALPGVVESEREQRSSVEIRYETRGGFGFAIGAGAAPPRRVLRFAGPPAQEITLSEAALGEVRAQLDASRRFLFGE